MTRSSHGWPREGARAGRRCGLRGVCQVLIADLLLGLCDGFFATAGPAVHGVLIEQFAQVAVRSNRYSVPARLIGRQVRVLLQASQPLVFDGRAPVARHERLPGRGEARLKLDHYLEALIRNPVRCRGDCAGTGPGGGEVHLVHGAGWAAACKAAPAP